MSHHKWLEKLAVLAILTGMALLFSSSTSTAQSDTQPRTLHNACVANCVLDMNFIHSNMGNSMARNAYHAWYDTYYILTGCDDPTWKTDLLFLFDIISDMVGAPGAPTMQCWQGLAAQAAGCSDSCSEYFLPDANYAPNLRLSLLSSSPGALEVLLNNRVHTDTLPERETLAYTRRFPLRTYLQLSGGTALLVNDSEMPSLSFPNWITQGGYDDCVTAYGVDDNRCQLIENLVVPAEISTSATFMDGALYDLSNQIAAQDGVSGSFSQNGFIILYSDEDSITIQQGPYAGVAWSKTHNKSTGSHTQQIEVWDAQNGNVTITNHECDVFYCGVFGDRTETDTYVYALQGPVDHRLAGTYTVQVVADLAHEKDFSDNTDSYTYESDAMGGQNGDPTAEPPEQALTLEEIPVIDLPGPGNYPNSVSPGVPGVMYRLNVPQGIRFMFIRLVSFDGNPFDAFVRRGSIPVPNYPVINNDYACWIQADAEYSGGCPFTAPYPDSYYIFLPSRQGGQFQIEIEWTTEAQSATQIAEATQSAQTTQTASGDDPKTFSDTEIESNNSRTTANPWNMQQPFTGKIAKWDDVDYIFLNFPEPGIYTFSVSDVGTEMRLKLSLFRATSGNYLDSSNASGKGAPVTLSMDASAGETYCLKISALAMSSGVTNQAYRLNLAGFIPDPYESNDNHATATTWNPANGPIEGYFWDDITGREDFYTFTAPETMDGEPILFTLTNPAPDMRIRLYLMRNNGIYLASSGLSGAGQSVQLAYTFTPGQVYHLRLANDAKTSFEPYTLSAEYVPVESNQGTTANSRPFRLHGFVYRQGGFLPDPLQNVTVYAQISGQATIRLDTTGYLGSFSGTVLMSEGQQVRIWAQQAGTTFQPAEEIWRPDERARSHRVIFIATGPELFQLTPTATPEEIGTSLPPLLQTALATPSETQSTPQPLATVTPDHTSEPPSTQSDTTISGTLWRVFPDSAPAGIGAAEVVLTINGTEQPAAFSMIDGTYWFQAPGLRPGDQLSLRAQNPGDNFEPVVYQWQAETGVDQWGYDFYSYWGEFPSAGMNDQNRIFGQVTGSNGEGLPGVYLVVQMGTSDALQRIGPTDADGYYDAFVTLPTRMMVSVWVEADGYLPSRVQYFNPYSPTNQEVNFWQP